MQRATPPIDPPLCDIDPTHGAMQPEPMYGTDGITIMQYGWFCQVKDCDGYGGPAPNPTSATTATPRKPKPIKGYVQENLL